MGLRTTCDGVAIQSSSCSRWKFEIFRDCVCSTRDAASFYLGLTSILCWAVAEVPQILTNWRTSDSEGISLAFILTWTIGDIFNVVGCLLDAATLPTQFFTAVLYSATTLLLIVKHIWHSLWRRAEEEEGEEAPNEQTEEGVGLNGTPSSAAAIGRLDVINEVPSPKHISHAAVSWDGNFPGSQSLAIASPIPPAAYGRHGTIQVARSIEQPRQIFRSPSSASIRMSPSGTSGSYTASWRMMMLSSSYSTSPRLQAVLVGCMITTGCVQTFWGQPHALPLLTFRGSPSNFLNPGHGDPMQGGGLVFSSRRLLQDPSSSETAQKAYAELTAGAQALFGDTSSALSASATSQNSTSTTSSSSPATSLPAGWEGEDGEGQGWMSAHVDRQVLYQVVGQILGWAMTFIYLTGRLPQVVLSFARGSAGDISIGMFTFALVGNLTYLTSILLRTLEWERVQPNLPWIVDSSACLLIDLTILWHYVWGIVARGRNEDLSFPLLK